MQVKVKLRIITKRVLSIFQRDAIPFRKIFIVKLLY